MFVRRAVRLGIVAVAALLNLRSAAHAGDSSPNSDAPLYLQIPEGDAGTLAPPTKGHLTEPPAPALPRRFSLGINDLGGQLRFHLNPYWAAEGRYLTGSTSSDVGTVRANVFGVRGYRFFDKRRRLRLYAGLEADYVRTSLASVDTRNNPNSVATLSGFGATSGYALGGFGGIEFRLLKRVALDFDIGPYMIGLKEKVTGVSDATLDFVANTAINVYLF